MDLISSNIKKTKVCLFVFYFVGLFDFLFFNNQNRQVNYTLDFTKIKASTFVLIFWFTPSSLMVVDLVLTRIVGK